MVWTGPLLPAPAPFDALGNPHLPDPNGYCACWNCPKWDGIQWWQPNREVVEEVTDGPA